ncbi:unnamed protein product [Amaranthus hypochondriacus]
MSPTIELQTYVPTTTTTTTTTAKIVTDNENSTASVTNLAAEMKPSLAQELARVISLYCPSPEKEMDMVAKYHNHKVELNQCCSVVVQRIAAPVETVWSMVRQFDKPQTYKHFLRSCRVIAGTGNQVGCVREVHVVSGIPANSSTERLEVLDEESHAIGFRVVAGEHRLQNYRSITTLHPTAAADSNTDSRCCNGTVVVESYVVDVPSGNTKEETCVFVDTIVSCNLLSLAKIAERIAKSSSSLSCEVL